MSEKDVTGCIFCEILAGRAEASFVYRDDAVAAFMDIRPVNAGHVLVVPLRHAAMLAELDEGDGGEMFRVAQRVAGALRAASKLPSSGVKCEGVNFFLADGRVAGQDVWHVHLHVFPRFDGDRHHLRFSPDYFKPVPRQEIEATAEKIRGVLNT
jgi:diadenosine tetraphosphate (Ap4A) HIT family hydrolase